MTRNTPLVTLLTGAALGVGLLIASMLQTPTNTPAGYAAPATASAATTPSSLAVASSAAAPSPAAPSPAAAPSSTAAAPSSPASYASPPATANFAGKVKGGGASVAVSIHGHKAIAYVCDGSHVEGWLKGDVTGGRLVMSGKNHAQLSLGYRAGQVTGDVVAHGTRFDFSVPTVHTPSGLYEATAVVRGVTVKAGWIVLPDGTQIGSLETDADAAAPAAIAAPVLDLATGTAEYQGVALHAIPVSGLTGSGF